jgi:glutaminyl-peptide cyclotransferase
MKVILLFILSFVAAIKPCEYEKDGYCVEKTCPMSLQFTQGLEVMPDGQHLLLSSGWYG